MTHQRKNIRDAIVQVLTTAGVVPSGRVFSNRLLVVNEELLPVVNVYMVEESSRPTEIGDGPMRRTLTVQLQGVVKSSDEASVDDALDDLAEKIETALAAAPTLSDTVEISLLTGTSMEGDATGDVAVGRLALTYKADYFA